MTDILNKIAVAVFKKQSLQDCSLEELKTMKEQYPWFAAARLLYTKKLKDIDPEKFSEEIKTTSLYISNPLWLDYLLNESEETLTLPGLEDTAPAEEYKEVPVEDFRNDELVIANGNGNGHVAEEKKEVAEIKIETEIEAKIENQAEVQAVNEFHQETTKELPNPSEKEKEEKLTFEPYHTVDYFASQGIREVQDNNPPDRFGKQLKSFTEWLKTLKKLPEATPSNDPVSGAEEKVISLAQQSLDDREVLTEAMADVWIKQGATEKAIAIYNKLSLLNPAKSSYFAGLIEKLKQS